MQFKVNEITPNAKIYDITRSNKRNEVLKSSKLVLYILNCCNSPISSYGRNNICLCCIYYNSTTF